MFLYPSVVRLFQDIIGYAQFFVTKFLHIVVHLHSIVRCKRFRKVSVALEHGYIRRVDAIVEVKWIIPLVDIQFKSELPQ